MSSLDLPPGRRVVVSSLAESPPEAIERMAIEPQPPPDPATLAPTDVIVAVRSAAVGWVDLIMASGQYQHVPRPPYTPGLEAAGEVVWAGPEATGVAPGQRVLIDAFRVGPRSHGAYQRYGGFATYTVAPAEAVLPLPDALSYHHAANLLGSYETAYHCLIARGRLQPGETVLVLGASGATGLAAVHIAKHLGATVIATGRSADKLAVVAAEGADHVIATGRDDGAPGVRDLRVDVKALTGGRGVDVVYDGVGGDLSREALRCARFGARYLIVGWAATPAVSDGGGRGGAPRANQLPTNLIMMKGLDVLGCPTVISTVQDPSLRPPRLAAVLGWAARGEVRPHVSRTYPLDEFKQALRDKWTGALVGGASLVP